MNRKDIDQISVKIRDLLEEKKDVLFCYLFGSFVRGDVIQKSDMDMAVFLSPKKRTNFFEMRLDLMEKLTRVLGRDADVIVLNTASPFLKYAVLREGVLVYNRDPEMQLGFELKAMNEYFDYKPILEMYRERLRASI